MSTTDPPSSPTTDQPSVPEAVGPPPETAAVLAVALANKLATAMVETSNVPLVLLDEAMHVVAISDSFRNAFGLDPRRAAGMSLYSLGDGEWDVPDLRSLLASVADGGAEVAAHEMTLRPSGHTAQMLVINAHRLVYGAEEAVRVLLTIADVTASRAGERLKAEMLRERAMMLRELQHRVANSLQIIASVLLQSARRVASDEARDHLTNAHSRVMSVASLQRLLAESEVGAVGLRAYFRQLAKSIASSMIADPERVTIVVDVDDTEVDSEVSVSLGLMVTELVLNALKHAFRATTRGTIAIGYATTDMGWRLSVRDDGIGMPTQVAKAGLGTSIVQALATQLDAVVTIEQARPGTRITIAHDAEKPDLMLDAPVRTA